MCLKDTIFRSQARNLLSDICLMAGQKVPPPIFTLRGHKSGVTALAKFTYQEAIYLVSGDEEGSIFIWSLSDFRRFKSYPTLTSSRVQSLKVIHLGNNLSKALVLQSRNEAIYILDLDTAMLDDSGQNLSILAEYPVTSSLFSRGDALDLSNGQALLAYPSCIENYLATIRVIGSGGVTLESGTAQRYSDESEKTCSVFDMSLLEESSESLYLFVGYEDGFLCVFQIFLKLKTSLPALNTEGMRIDLIKKLDLKIGDFVSAFDVIRPKEGFHTIVCGSPLQTLTVIKAKLEDKNYVIQTDNIMLKRQGVSSVAIRPDCMLYALAGWDSSVKLYSMKSGKLLAILSHHMKQVQHILFVETYSHEYSKNELHASTTKTGRKFLLCCASIEGTISISDIY